MIGYLIGCYYNGKQEVDIQEVAGIIDSLPDHWLIVALISVVRSVCFQCQNV